MKIEDNAIVYNDHKVILDKELHQRMPEYISEMAEELSVNGDKRQHAAELRYMNNDGSWSIKKL